MQQCRWALPLPPYAEERRCDMCLGWPTTFTMGDLKQPLWHYTTGPGVCRNVEKAWSKYISCVDNGYHQAATNIWQKFHMHDFCLISNVKRVGREYVFDKQQYIYEIFWQQGWHIEPNCIDVSQFTSVFRSSVSGLRCTWQLQFFCSFIIAMKYWLLKNCAQDTVHVHCAGRLDIILVS